MEEGLHPTPIFKLVIKLSTQLLTFTFSDQPKTTQTIETTTPSIETTTIAVETDQEDHEDNRTTSSPSPIAPESKPNVFWL